MIPPELAIEIYQGDSFGDGWLIALPDLTSRGGPATLTGATVRAQIREKVDPASTVFADFTVDTVDATLRQVRPKLTPDQTAAIPKKGYWDLQVETRDASGAVLWRGTVLRGPVSLFKDITR